MATQTKLLPDGSKVFFDSDNPSVQYRVDETTGAQSTSSDGGQTWKPAAASSGNDLPSNLSNFAVSKVPAATLGDTLTTLAKNAPLAAGVGLSSVGGGGASPDMASSVTPSAAGSTDITALADILSKAGASDLSQGNTADQIKIALLNAGINAKKLGVTAPATRLATGERAALAKAATPAQVHWDGPGSGLKGEVPSYTGGIKSIYAANQDPTMQALHDQVLNDSLVGEMNGGASGGNQDASLGTAADAGQGSTAGDALGAVGLGTSIAATLAKLGIFGKGPTPTPDTVDGILNGV